MKPILVTCYVNPDLDGAAGAVAYAEFLQKISRDAIAGIMGELHDEAIYIFDLFSFEYPKKILNGKNYDKIILVDSSDLIGLEGKIPPEKVIEIIDHRQVHEAGSFPRAKTQIELVGAAATLIAEKFMKNKIDISKKSARLLYGAIISNTLNFKAGVTTSRDREAALWLCQIARPPENFWQKILLAKSDMPGQKLAMRIQGDFAWFIMDGKKIGIAQLEMIKVEDLIKQRGDEIIKILEKIKAKTDLDYIFLTAIELIDDKNFFIAVDEQTKILIEKVLHVRFESDCAVRQGLIMRKQIVPLFKKEIERQKNPEIYF